MFHLSRKLLCTTLIFVLTFSPLFSAAEVSPQKSFQEFTKLYLSQRNHLRNSAMQRKATGWRAQLSRQAKNQLIQGAQVIPLLLVLSGMAVAQHEIQESAVSGEPLQTTEILKLYSEVSQSVLTSGQVWLGLLSAHASGAALEKPVMVFQQLLRNSNTNPLLSNLLASGLQSSFTFMGWELGSQLWQEARLLLENTEDYNKTENIYSLLKTSSESLESRRLLSLLFNNLSLILLFENDLRQQWLYNTWRLKIASGSFVTLVASLAGASALGTTLFPGAGTILGAAFGFVGYGAFLAIPQEAKDFVTFSIELARATHNKIQLNISHKGLSTLTWISSEFQSSKPLPLIHNMAQSTKLARERYMNVLYEAYYTAQTRIQILTVNRMLLLGRLQKDGPQSALQVFTSQLKQSLVLAGFPPAALFVETHSLPTLLKTTEESLWVYKKVQQTLRPLFLNFYREELTRFRSYTYASLPLPVAYRIQNEIKNLEILEWFHSHFVESLAQNIEQENQSLALVTKHYFGGLDESTLTNFAKQLDVF
ncbi:MAG: hypothetical protein AB7F59_13225 [Bdellovibrionales bacterium]